MKYNKALRNKKSNGIMSMLREHFKDLGFNEDQQERLGGRLILKLDRSIVSLHFYYKEKRHVRHILKKKEDWTLPERLRWL